MTDREFHRKLDHVMSRVIELGRKVDDSIIQLRHMVEASNKNTEVLVSLLSSMGVKTSVDGEEPAPEEENQSQEIPQP